jgi:hypothetical protein
LAQLLTSGKSPVETIFEVAGNEDGVSSVIHDFSRQCGVIDA